MAETLESIKQEIAKIAAEKADLKGIVDQQKDTIKRQETTIGNLQEALKAADANMVDRVNKLQKEIDHYKKALNDETKEIEEESDKAIEQLQKDIAEFKEALNREATDNVKLIKEVGMLTELKEDLKAELEASKSAHTKTWEEKENFREKNLELQQKVSKLEAIRDTYAKEIDVLNGDIEELKANGSPGTIAALAAKDEELRKLGEKVPAKDREINDLKEQVKSLEEALDLKGDYYYRAQTEKEHLANAIENAYRSLMITRGYQLPGESGESNG